MNYLGGKRTGFTIVELLIVVVVVAILAAITVVAYGGITDRAKSAAVNSEMKSFMKKIDTIKTTAADSMYPASIPIDFGLKVNKSLYTTGRNNWYYCTTSDRQSYSLGVVTGANGVGFTARSSSGVIATATAIDAAATCALLTGTTSYTLGYNWNSTTLVGTWNAGLN